VGCRAIGTMAACLWAVAAVAAPLTPDEASNHVGQTATVCGEVASTKYDAHLRSQPTFLDFGKPYPNRIFTAVIFGRDRAKFGTPEATFRGRRVCVTGQVRNYRGKPEIIVSDPGQLTQ
jgi:DNA/RNA endonuclease YhcR with UshA esterase domain